jgi:hypothetical protein
MVECLEAPQWTIWTLMDPWTRDRSGQIIEDKTTSPMRKMIDDWIRFSFPLILSFFLFFLFGLGFLIFLFPALRRPM